jgi:hypothetical protein
MRQSRSEIPANEKGRSAAMPSSMRDAWFVTGVLAISPWVWFWPVLCWLLCTWRLGGGSPIIIDRLRQPRPKRSLGVRFGTSRLALIFRKGAVASVGRDSPFHRPARP